MIFDGADRAIREMNRANLKLFGRLKMANWDRLNVLTQVSIAYAESVALAKRLYRKIAEEAYLAALAECGAPKRDRLYDWVDEMLEDANALTLYSFNAETERKKQRLVEAVSVAANPGQEVDKALRLWTLQLSQYADIFVDAARLMAFEDADVTDVVWVTARDERVCEECEPLDGQVFRISEAPKCPAHWRCRCRLVGAGAYKTAT